MTKIAKSTTAADHPRHIRSRRGRALIGAAAAFVAVAALAAPASAKPFQQYLNGACGPTICKIDFVKVPVGQRLEVSNASCYLRLKGTATTSAEIFALQLLVVGANPANVLSAVTMAPRGIGSNDPDENVFSNDDAMFAFANAQQHFQAFVQISGGSFSQVACHISGNLVKVV
jgi:hypothetical protein